MSRITKDFGIIIAEIYKKFESIESKSLPRLELEATLIEFLHSTQKREKSSSASSSSASDDDSYNKTRIIPVILNTLIALNVLKVTEKGIIELNLAQKETLENINQSIVLLESLKQEGSELSNEEESLIQRLIEKVKPRQEEQRKPLFIPEEEEEEEEKKPISMTRKRLNIEEMRLNIRNLQSELINQKGLLESTLLASNPQARVPKVSFGPLGMYIPISKGGTLHHSLSFQQAGSSAGDKIGLQNLLNELKPGYEVERRTCPIDFVQIASQFEPWNGLDTTSLSLSSPQASASNKWLGSPLPLGRQSSSPPTWLNSPKLVSSASPPSSISSPKAILNSPKSMTPLSFQVLPCPPTPPPFVRIPQCLEIEDPLSFVSNQCNNTNNPEQEEVDDIFLDPIRQLERHEQGLEAFRIKFEQSQVVKKLNPRKQTSNKKSPSNHSSSSTSRRKQSNA